MLNRYLGRVDDEVLLEGRHLVAEGLRKLRIDLKHELPDAAEDTLNLQRCFGDISLCQVFHFNSF